MVHRWRRTGVVVLGVVLAACGAGGGQEGEGAAEAPTEAPAPVATSATPAGASPSAGTVAVAAGLTPDHVAVPGTAVHLAPPPGFVVSSSFSGFEDVANGAAILVVQLDGSVEEIRTSMTTEVLGDQGMQEHSREPVGTAQDPGAILIGATQDAGGITFGKWIHVMGSATTSVQVQATWPEELPELQEPMRQAVLSAVLGDLVVESEHGFAVDPPAGFEELSLGVGSVAYRQGEDGPILVASRSLGDSTVPASELGAAALLDSTPYTGIEALTSGPITVDGLDGFSITANATGLSGEPVWLHQVVLFDDGEHYRLLAEADRADEAARAVLDGMIASFRLTP